jgi:hypothetical protein
VDSSGAGNARAEDEDLCEQPFNEAPQFGPKATQAKKRIFVTLDKRLSYFISLVYTEHGLALGTAFPPRRRMVAQDAGQFDAARPMTEKGNPATCAGFGFAAH